MEWENEYTTRLAYRGNNSWTGERGASKFIDQFIKSAKQERYGGWGCVINGFSLTPGGKMSVNINTKADGQDGHCMIRYANYAYLGWLVATHNVELTGADQGLPRITLIVAYVDLNVDFIESDRIMEAPGVLKFKAIDGTPAASPTPPSIAQIQSELGLNNPYVVLGEVRVPKGVNDITQGDITDYTKDEIKAIMSPDIEFDKENSYVAGVYQCAPNLGQKTRIVITGPNAQIPEAIPGVEIIWIRKKL